MRKLFIVSLLSAVAIPALGAESVNISVVGSISAASCLPSVEGGGVVDYGFIKPDALAESGPTVLEVKTIGFSVICDAFVNVALRAYSNRVGTATDIATPENSAGSATANSALINAGLGQNMPYGQMSMTKPAVAGLGIANGNNIGGYMLTLPPELILLDGEPVTTKYFTYNSPNANSNWNKEAASTISNNGHSIFSEIISYFSYSADSGLSTPEPFKELTGTLLVQAYITDKSNLDLSSPVNLDGFSTIELYYF